MKEETKLRFEEKGTGDILRDIKGLKMTSVQRVEDLLERIEYEYKYNAGAAYGTLSESEVRHRYKLLLDAIPNIPGLTHWDIKYLNSLVQEKIKDIPRHELAQINAFLNNEKAVDQVVNQICAEQGVSYSEAKKQFLTEMKERADKYNKMIEDDKKTPVTPGDSEPGDGGNR